MQVINIQYVQVLLQIICENKCRVDWPIRRHIQSEQNSGALCTRWNNAPAHWYTKFYNSPAHCSIVCTNAPTFRRIGTPRWTIPLKEKESYPSQYTLYYLLLGNNCTIFVVDFIQTHFNLELDRCIFTRVEKYYLKIIFPQFQTVFPI